MKLTVLRQKFDCLGWLVRNHEFVKPDLQNELIKAFRETELPQNDNARRKKFAVTVTNSQAILSICSQFTTIVKKDFDEKKIKLTLKVLEILTRNEESVNIGVLHGKL